MKKFLSLALFGLLSFSSPVFAEAVVGQMAPAFGTVDSNGVPHSLADLKGKYVVLEWLNHGCPFVKKHYSSGNMQKLQKTYTAKDVVWLSVASSAPGKEGYMTADETNAAVKEKQSAASAVLMDTDGRIGRAYGAKTTPHMFVIDPSGKLIYAGAIDDNDSARASSVEGAKNYVAQALDEAMAGKAVSEPVTEAYGCSVKYQS